MKARIHIFGRHGKRTPFAYEPYRRLLSRHFDLSVSAEEADFLIIGFVLDIKENFELLHRLCKSSLRRIVVISEEPLWDTVWTPGFTKRSGSVECNGEFIEYTYLNHWTASIYSFAELPYFITTSDEYFVRYSYMFQRNAQLSTNDLLSIWRNADGKAALIFEKRNEVQFDCQFPECSTFGLSRYRTLFALETLNSRVKVFGKGWTEGPARQVLHDWHLDKLAEIDRRYLFSSAIENTHAPNYITEKVFDSFAAATVPITYFKQDHAIERLGVKEALFDVSSKTPSEAAESINIWRPGLTYAKAYVQTQRRLAALFKNPDVLVRERERLVSALLGEIEHAMS